MPLSRQASKKGLGARRAFAVVLAKNQLLHRAGMANDARLRDLRGDVGDAADHVFGPRASRKMSSFATPFCNETTAAFSPRSGLTASAASSLSHSFTVNSTRSTGPIFGRLTGDLNGAEVHVAERALHPQSVGAQRLRAGARGPRTPPHRRALASLAPK